MDASQFSPSNFDNCNELPKAKEGYEQTIYILIIEMKDQIMDNLKSRVEKKNCKENSITKKKQRETYLKDTIFIAPVVCRFVASSCF
jgi:hypothetical protein